MNERALLTYLVTAGILGADVLRSGTANVVDLSRSHAVFAVTVPDRPGLVVKRARPRAGGHVASIERELAVYSLAQSSAALAAAVPVCLLIDPSRQILVLRMVEPGETLHEGAHVRGEPSVERARRLGELVAAWQRETSGQPPDLAREEPWVLGILTPGRWRPAIADALLVHGVVRRELRAQFARLSGLLAPSCLVHGDLKWDNCLAEGADGVRIVDWEMAAVGDPAWDVAGIVTEHAVARRAGAVDAKGATAGSEPRAQSQAAVDAFLAAYCAARPDGDEVLRRALELAGARLVQTALEWAAAGTAEPLAAALLGDAVDALREPERLLEPAAAL